MEQQSKKAIKAERDAELAQLGIKPAAPKKTAAPIPMNTNAVEIVEHEEMTEGRMLEDKIEDMRRNLPPNLTKITPESFAVWYAKKKKEKAEKRAKKQSKRDKDIALGKVAMTGKELFERKRSVFVDDERADDDTYENDETTNVFIASLEEQMRLDAESNETEFDEEKFKVERDRILAQIKADRANKASQASSAPSSTPAAATSTAPTDIDVNSLAAAPPIDESLFNEDDIPDDLPEDEE